MKKQNKPIIFCCAVWLIFFINGCRSALNEPPSVITVQPSPVASVPNKTVKLETLIDVPKFAGRSAAELEKVLGKPKEIKAVAGNLKQQLGEYRLYQLPNHPQGLSVHFYNGQAAVFNLVLGKAENSPSAALAKYFSINVENTAPIEKTQFLEKWQGEFNKVKFISVYAMRERLENSDYKLLHAEIAR